MPADPIAPAVPSPINAPIAFVRQFIESELFRYLLASALALSVDAGSLYLLTSVFGIHYLLSAGIGFGAGLVTVYLLSIHWVFRKRSLANARHELMIFIAIGLMGLGINELGMYLMTELAGLHFMLSKGLVALVVFSWNFVVRKLMLFR